MSYPYAPQELRVLPFNLRRSQLYPVNPPLVDQAIEDQLAGSPRPILMPGKTAYTKWHTGPAARGYFQTAISAVEAGAIYTDKVEGLAAPIEADKGIFTPFQASLAFNRLPQPMDNFEFNADPVARGVLARPITQAPDLDAFARGATTEVQQRTLFSTALEGDMTPLGGLRGTRGLGGLGRAGFGRTRAGRGWLRGLGRFGMGLGALGDPIDIMVEPLFDPRAEPIDLSTNQATPGASSQVVTTVTTPAIPPAAATALPATGAGSRWGTTFFALAGLVGMGAGIYHGWKRTHSTPWTVVWGLAGGVFPIFAVPVMFVQGFGKRGGR